MSSSLAPSAAWTRPGQMVEGTHYIVSGSEGGETVLLVHGIGGYHGHWDYLTPVLEGAGYRVVRYDLVGRGFSEPDHHPQPYSGESHVSQLETVVGAACPKNKPFHIVAHSMGGALSILYTAKHPETVSKLVLLSPAGLMDLGPVALLRSLPWCLHGCISNVLKGGQENAWRDDFHTHGSEVEEEVRSRRKDSFVRSSNP
jgi:pimeloyl-ACP methyl ester carboxylesterase